MRRRLGTYVIVALLVGGCSKDGGDAKSSTKRALDQNESGEAPEKGDGVSPAAKSLCDLLVKSKDVLGEPPGWYETHCGSYYTKLLGTCANAAEIVSCMKTMTDPQPVDVANCKNKCSPATGRE